MKTVKRWLIGLSAYILAGVATVVTLDWHFGGGPTGLAATPFVIGWPAVLIVLAFKYLEFLAGTCDG